jgi:DNA-3-methyladenine glycosylase
MGSANRRGRTTRLPRSFYRRDVIAVARGLLGQRLVSEIGDSRVSGVIVETEAYLGTIDKAAHTYDGRRTTRNETMWGNGGHVYVYFVYGMHHCVNVVAGGPGEPVAVLLRGLEPDDGTNLMFERRAAARRPIDLCSGPGKLCQALGITRAVDGEDVVEGERLFIERLRRRTLLASAIACGPRVGVGYAEEWQHEPLRFWVRGNRNVSRSRGATS